jgi:hypothetical protein
MLMLVRCAHGLSSISFGETFDHNLLDRRRFNLKMEAVGFTAMHTTHSSSVLSQHQINESVSTISHGRNLKYAKFFNQGEGLEYCCQSARSSPFTSHIDITTMVSDLVASNEDLHTAVSTPLQHRTIFSTH